MSVVPCQLICEICNRAFSDRLRYKIHTDGLEHRELEARLQLSNYSISNEDDALVNTNDVSETDVTHTEIRDEANIISDDIAEWNLSDISFSVVTTVSNRSVCEADLTYIANNRKLAVNSRKVYEAHLNNIVTNNENASNIRLKDDITGVEATNINSGSDKNSYSSNVGIDEEKDVTDTNIGKDKLVACSSLNRATDTIALNFQEDNGVIDITCVEEAHIIDVSDSEELEEGEIEDSEDERRCRRHKAARAASLKRQRLLRLAETVADSASASDYSLLLEREKRKVKERERGKHKRKRSVHEEALIAQLDEALSEYMTEAPKRTNMTHVNVSKHVLDKCPSAGKLTSKQRKRRALEDKIARERKLGEEIKGKVADVHESKQESKRLRLKRRKLRARKRKRLAGSVDVVSSTSERIGEYDGTRNFDRLSSSFEEARSYSERLASRNANDFPPNSNLSLNNEEFYREFPLTEVYFNELSNRYRMSNHPAMYNSVLLDKSNNGDINKRRLGNSSGLPMFNSFTSFEGNRPATRSALFNGYETHCLPSLGVSNMPLLDNLTVTSFQHLRDTNVSVLGNSLTNSTSSLGLGELAAAKQLPYHSLSMNCSTVVSSNMPASFDGMHQENLSSLPTVAVCVSKAVQASLYNTTSYQVQALQPDVGSYCLQMDTDKSGAISALPLIDSHDKGHSVIPTRSLNFNSHEVESHSDLVRETRKCYSDGFLCDREEVGSIIHENLDDMIAATEKAIAQLKADPELQLLGKYTHLSTEEFERVVRESGINLIEEPECVDEAATTSTVLMQNDVDKMNNCAHVPVADSVKNSLAVKKDCTSKIEEIVQEVCNASVDVNISNSSPVSTVVSEADGIVERLESTLSSGSVSAMNSIVRTSKSDNFDTNVPKDLTSASKPASSNFKNINMQKVILKLTSKIGKTSTISESFNNAKSHTKVTEQCHRISNETVTKCSNDDNSKLPDGLPLPLNNSVAESINTVIAGYLENGVDLDQVPPPIKPTYKLYNNTIFKIKCKSTKIENLSTFKRLENMETCGSIDGSRVKNTQPTTDLSSCNQVKDNSQNTSDSKSTFHETSVSSPLQNPKNVKCTHSFFNINPNKRNISEDGKLQVAGSPSPSIKDSVSLSMDSNISTVNLLDVSSNIEVSAAVWDNAREVISELRNQKKTKIANINNDAMKRSEEICRIFPSLPISENQCIVSENENLVISKLSGQLRSGSLNAADKEISLDSMLSSPFCQLAMSADISGADDRSQVGVMNHLSKVKCRRASSQLGILTKLSSWAKNFQGDKAVGNPEVPPVRDLSNDHHEVLDPVSTKSFSLKNSSTIPNKITNKATSATSNSKWKMLTSVSSTSGFCKSPTLTDKSDGLSDLAGKYDNPNQNSNVWPKSEWRKLFPSANAKHPLSSSATEHTLPHRMLSTVTSVSAKLVSFSSNSKTSDRISFRSRESLASSSSKFTNSESNKASGFSSNNMPTKVTEINEADKVSSSVDMIEPISEPENENSFSSGRWSTVVTPGKDKIETSSFQNSVVFTDTTAPTFNERILVSSHTRPIIKGQAISAQVLDGTKNPSYKGEKLKSWTGRRCKASEEICQFVAADSAPLIGSDSVGQGSSSSQAVVNEYSAQSSKIGQLSSSSQSVKSGSSENLTNSNKILDRSSKQSVEREAISKSNIPVVTESPALANKPVASISAGQSSSKLKLMTRTAAPSSQSVVIGSTSQISKSDNMKAITSSPVVKGAIHKDSKTPQKNSAAEENNSCTGSDVSPNTGLVIIDTWNPNDADVSCIGDEASNFDVINRSSNTTLGEAVVDVSLKEVLNIDRVNISSDQSDSDVSCMDGKTTVSMLKSSNKDVKLHGVVISGCSKKLPFSCKTDVAYHDKTDKAYTKTDQVNAAAGFNSEVCSSNNATSQVSVQNSRCSVLDIPCRLERKSEELACEVIEICDSSDDDANQRILLDEQQQRDRRYVCDSARIGESVELSEKTLSAKVRDPDIEMVSKDGKYSVANLESQRHTDSEQQSILNIEQPIRPKNLYAKNYSRSTLECSNISCQEKVSDDLAITSNDKVKNHEQDDLMYGESSKGQILEKKTHVETMNVSPDRFSVRSPAGSKLSSPFDRQESTEEAQCVMQLSRIGSARKSATVSSECSTAGKCSDPNGVSTPDINDSPEINALSKKDEKQSPEKKLLKRFSSKFRKRSLSSDIECLERSRSPGSRYSRESRSPSNRYGRESRSPGSKYPRKRRSPDNHYPKRNKSPVSRKHKVNRSPEDSSRKLLSHLKNGSPGSCERTTGCRTLRGSKSPRFQNRDNSPIFLRNSNRYCSPRSSFHERSHSPEYKRSQRHGSQSRRYTRPLAVRSPRSRSTDRIRSPGGESLENYSSKRLESKKSSKEKLASNRPRKGFLSPPGTSRRKRLKLPRQSQSWESGEYCSPPAPRNKGRSCSCSSHYTCGHCAAYSKTTRRRSRSRSFDRRNQRRSLSRSPESFHRFADSVRRRRSRSRSSGDPGRHGQSINVVIGTGRSRPLTPKRAFDRRDYDRFDSNLRAGRISPFPRNSSPDNRPRRIPSRENWLPNDHPDFRNESRFSAIEDRHHTNEQLFHMDPGRPQIKMHNPGGFQPGFLPEVHGRPPAGFNGAFHPGFGARMIVERREFVFSQGPFCHPVSTFSPQPFWPCHRNRFP